MAVSLAGLLVYFAIVHPTPSDPVTAFGLIPVGTLMVVVNYSTSNSYRLHPEGLDQHGTWWKTSPPRFGIILLIY